MNEGKKICRSQKKISQVQPFQLMSTSSTLYYAVSFVLSKYRGLQNGVSLKTKTVNLA